MIYVFAPPLWLSIILLFLFQTYTDWSNEDLWYSSLEPILVVLFYGFYSLGCGNILYQYLDDAILYYKLEEKAIYEKQLVERERAEAAKAEADRQA